jgi:hypothetical protein
VSNERCFIGTCYSSDSGHSHQLNYLPLKTPTKAKINALKQTKDRAADVLRAEQDRQKQAKAAERVGTAQQALIKARLGTD